MTPLQARDIIGVTTEWAVKRTDIVALGLAGSWARNAAHEESDIDLILLAFDPDSFRANRSWVYEINWSSIGLAIREFDDSSYGAAWSRRIITIPQTEIEMTFGGLDWASVDPIDGGTKRVVIDGFRVLADKSGLLELLVAACKAPD
jgi:uncharacterized protein